MRHTQEPEPVRTERAQMGDKGKTNNIRNANADPIQSRADTSLTTRHVLRTGLRTAHGTPDHAPAESLATTCTLTSKYGPAIFSSKTIRY